tara:strand:+ start:72 stop:251 length:180 start_codon:yes stop_codon:yes gene_type:complete
MNKKIFSEFKKIVPWLLVPSLYYIPNRQEAPLIDYFFAFGILLLVIYLFFWALRYFNIR